MHKGRNMLVNTYRSQSISQTIFRAKTVTNKAKVIYKAKLRFAVATAQKNGNVSFVFVLEKNTSNTCFLICKDYML